MSIKLDFEGFKQIENTSQFSKDFIKSFNEDSNKGSFPEDDVQYPEKLHNLHNDLRLLPKKMKVEKVEKLVAK